MGDNSNINNDIINGCITTMDERHEELNNKLTTLGTRMANIEQGALAKLMLKKPGLIAKL